MKGSPRRVLVIEDDLETGKQLVESLAANGYQVDLAVNGNEGLSRGLATEYAVMTIDRMLPGIDGVAIIRRLREAGIATPALIISALGEVDDRVRGLRAGGDEISRQAILLHRTAGARRGFGSSQRYCREGNGIASRRP